ncbi:heme o synthase [Allorhizobium borbori]|uniref:Protoheme IX farnesyltransferase n=1 Tax=Allorhizobium borbori TaxID=485907 RepID=A0A7W6K391_9HYPH|nr:heme o synthase [Allorhizobium borbori]MBB4104400.1 protoheme IX farnesyltransferase [Allorhizobium borbori]
MSVTGHHETTAATASLRMLAPRLRDYFALMKPRVMSLVVFTAFAGLFLAPGGIAPASGVLTILCIAVGAGASGALNMWYDADIDRIMSRTRERPVPAGRVSPVEALVVGITLSIISVLTLGLGVNWLSAGLLAFTIFFYAVIYTMILKRRTPQNIVIGGASGALPPMIGWAAVTGTVSVESVLLFLIIFLWTPPHFWSLALFKCGDYGDAGVPMLPVVAGERATKIQIVAYAVPTALIGIAPALIGMAGITYGLFAAVLGAIFVVYSLGVFRMPEGDPKMMAAKKNFAYSIFYLFTIFSALMADKLADRLPGLLS